MSERWIRRWLDHTEYRVYHANLGRALGGLHEVIILQDLCEWEKYSSDGWTYRTIKQIEEATLLTKSMQQIARTKLVDLGVLIEEKRGMPARNYYRVDYDRLAGIVEAFENDAQLPATSGRYTSHRTQASQPLDAGIPATIKTLIDPKETPTEDDLSERARERRSAFEAYANAVGFQSQFERQRADTASSFQIAELQRNEELPQPNQVSDLTRYTIAQLRFAGIGHQPRFDQVMARFTEYKQWWSEWLIAGKPMDGLHPDYLLLRRKANGKERPATDYDQSRGTYAESIMEGIS